MIRILTRLLLTTLFAVRLLTEVAQAAEGRQPLRIGSGWSAYGDCCWNPNDYCRKCPPLDPCPSPGCYADCYDRKPLPCIPCTAGCATADDYLQKCYPVPPCQCPTAGLPHRIYVGTHRDPQPASIRNPGIALW